MRPVASVATGSVVNTSQTSKVIRNTYSLLAITLIFSAITAGVSMTINPPWFTGLICSLTAMALIWFVLPRTANSVAGLGVAFAITGLLGFGLGPILNHYLGMANGGAIIMQAMATTGITFLALSAYVLTTKKDFSFMGGFLMAGLIAVIVLALVVMVSSMFGVDVSGFSLAISGLVVLLMCGLILFETSNIVNGGETNYIMATVGLYLSIYNLFTALLHLIGAFSGDD
ncbi:MAG TPA: Bax inhibitor-1/YccA family protein [Candidatus Tenderia sp.]|nr:Bax inhibitor-1/YccA family protein [Candidatus Tenderia sp.]